MGLKLRYNLFFEVEAEEVYAALESYWNGHGRRLLATAPQLPPDSASDGYELHRRHDGWTLLSWDGGWEWELRRAAQLHVSRVLGCAGLLVFVYDGDYWGYELFNDGREVDHFVLDPEAAGWFPGRPCSGDPALFAAQFPAAGLRPADIASYLMPMPENWEDPGWNTPARAGDRFTRGAECAVLDFLRMLGADFELRTSDGGTRGYVTPLAPLWRSFEVATAVGS
jgi:hypothetical protein